MHKAAPVDWAHATESATLTLAPSVESPTVKLRDLAEIMLKKQGYTYKGSQSEPVGDGTLWAFRGTKKVGGTFSAAYAVAMIEADGTLAWMEWMGRRDKERHFKFVAKRKRSVRRSQRGKEL